MTQEQFEKRQERAENETLIISRTDEGFRVYCPAYPTKSYTVSESPEEPLLPGFPVHEGDSQRLCKHIMAVFNQLEKSEKKSDQTDPYEGEERKESRGLKNGLSER